MHFHHNNVGMRVKIPYVEHMMGNAMEKTDARDQL